MSSPSMEDTAATLRGDDRRAVIATLIALESGALALDARVAAACVELLAEPSKDVSRRAAGALVRAAASDELAAGLTAALGDADPLRRWGAAFALARGGRGDEAVLAAAVDALALDDGDIRWAAAEIVRELVRAQPDLLGVVAEAAGREPAVRRKMALYCLRDLRDLTGADDRAIFVAALDDADRGVRLAALSGVAAAGRIGAPHSRDADDADRIVERVVACMDGDADPGLRRAAAATLGKLKSTSPAAVAALERVRDTSDDADLLRAAIGALR